MINILPLYNTLTQKTGKINTINIPNLVQHPNPQTGKITTINMPTWYNTLTHKQVK